MRIRKRFVVLLFIAAAALAAKEAGVFSILKSDAAIGKQATGAYLLPTNQLLRPWGEQAEIPGRPVDLAFDSSKRLLAVLNWKGVQILDGSTGIQIGEVKSTSTSYAGIAFRPGDREL